MSPSNKSSDEGGAMESMEDSTCAHSVVAVMLIGSRFVMVFLRLFFFLDPSHLESILCCNGTEARRWDEYVKSNGRRTVSKTYPLGSDCHE